MLANRPLTETIQMGIRFARGVWLARKFDTKGLVDTGRRVKIVKQNGEIHVDRYCRFRDDVEMAVVGENAGRKSILRIGYNSGLGARTKINVTDLVDIGDNCLIGWDCDIWDTSWHRVRFLDRESGPISSPVVIEDNVWVGAHTIIQRGVTIGANSVIAAGSVVIKDIPPNSFAAGNPSKVLKEIEGWEW
ncbi:MAG: acyltransferase [Planctomycetes bacterium]|nr:acyltransferase [Planctomycetota bacterium]